MKNFLIGLLILGTITIGGCSIVEDTYTSDTNQQTGLVTDILETREISLYYHNLKEDEKQYEWISFNEEFILPIKRDLVISKTPIKDTFDLLFKADLTVDELEQGFVQGVFETYKFEIKSLVLTDGLLKIDFTNNIYLDSMSSAQSSIFFTSIQKTAKQFPEIKNIEFKNGTIIDINL